MIIFTDYDKVNVILNNAFDWKADLIGEQILIRREITNMHRWLIIIRDFLQKEYYPNVKIQFSK